MKLDNLFEYAGWALLLPIFFCIGLVAWLLAYPVSKYTKVPFIIACNTLLLSQYISAGIYIFNLNWILLVVIGLVQTLTGYAIAMFFTEKDKWVSGYNGEYAVISGVFSSLAVMLSPVIQKLLLKHGMI